MRTRNELLDLDEWRQTRMNDAPVDAVLINLKQLQRRKLLAVVVPRSCGHGGDF